MNQIKLTKQNKNLFLNMFADKVTEALKKDMGIRDSLQTLRIQEPALTLLENKIFNLFIMGFRIQFRDMPGYIRDIVHTLQEKENLEIVFDEE